MYLGVALFVRGIVLSMHPRLDIGEISQLGAFWPPIIGHYVIVAHIVGGLLLALGMVTRFAAAVQLPALFGAVFLVHLHEGLTRTFAGAQALELSALVLFLLLVYTVFGSGRLSVDRYLFADHTPPYAESSGE
jgi:uncharacterized membrane protein YphA (DoxX/SURF4 family)